MLTARSVKPGAETCSDEYNPLIFKQTKRSFHRKVSIRTGSSLALALRELRVKSRSKKKVQKVVGKGATKTRKLKRKKRKTGGKPKRRARARSSTPTDICKRNPNARKLARRSMSLSCKSSPLLARTAFTSQTNSTSGFKSEKKLNFFMSSTGITQIKAKRTRKKRPSSTDPCGKKPNNSQTRPSSTDPCGKKPNNSQTINSSNPPVVKSPFTRGRKHTIHLRTPEGKKKKNSNVIDSSESKQPQTSKPEVLDDRESKIPHSRESKELKDVTPPELTPENIFSTFAPVLPFHSPPAVTATMHREAHPTKPKSRENTPKTSAIKKKSKLQKHEPKLPSDWLEKLSRDDLLKLLSENGVREVEVYSRVYRIQTSRGRNGPSHKMLQVWAIDWWKRKKEEAKIARERWLQILQDKSVDPCLSSREYAQVLQKIRDFKAKKSAGKQTLILQPPHWVLETLMKEE